MKKLLEVKKEIGTLTKNSKNPFFKSQYLDLNAILEEIDPIMQKHGLILLQPIKANEVFTSIIDSENGQTIATSSMVIPSTITDPQKMGACVTYFRRYTLKSLLGIAEQDDDGTLACKPEPIKKKLNDEQFDRFLLQDKKTIQYQQFDFNFTEEQKNIIELTLKID